MNCNKKFIGWLTINRACNLSCEWCYAKVMKFAGAENMTLNLVKQSVDLLNDLNVKSIILIGGEPTIHPDFIEIVKIIKNANIHPLVVTNSIKFLDNNFLEKTIEAGVHAITTSLKAGSNEKYFQFTGKRYFYKVMKGIENIHKSGIRHKISITIYDNSTKDFMEILDAIVKSDTSLFSIDMGRPIIINNQVNANKILSPKEMADFIMKIYPKLISCGTKFNIKFSIPFCLFPKEFLDCLIESKHITSGCQIFNGDGIIIDSIGRLLPCNHFCDNPLGKLGTDFCTAEEYCQFREREDIADFYKKISSCPTQECVDCSFWKDCGGGCRINWLYYNKNELTGNFRRKEV